MNLAFFITCSPYYLPSIDHRIIVIVTEYFNWIRNSSGGDIIETNDICFINTRQIDMLPRIHRSLNIQTLLFCDPVEWAHLFLLYSVLIGFKNLIVIVTIIVKWKNIDLSTIGHHNRLHDIKYCHRYHHPYHYRVRDCRMTCHRR